MFGDFSGNPSQQSPLLANSGLVLRSISQIFEYKPLENYTVYLSFLQIYNEKIFDLLNPALDPRPLQIRESKLYGIFVEGLSEFIVQGKPDCFNLILKGNSTKAIRHTKFNLFSSRSHTILQVQLESNIANKKGNLKSSKLSLCDLAGSEKFDKEGQMVNGHLREMTQINKSLTTLGKVIQELGKKKCSHVPYRDSKLTRLLQDCLGKSTKTVLIATISQSQEVIEETLNTLKFADRAKLVMLRTKKNEFSAVNSEIVNKLQKEIAHLKTLLGLRNKGGIDELQQKLVNLTEENKVLKRRATLVTVDEVEKLKIENKLLRLELQNFGIVQNSGDPFKDSNDYSHSNIKPGELSTKLDNLNQSQEIKIFSSSEKPNFLLNGEFSPIQNPKSQLKVALSAIDIHKALKIRTKTKDSQKFSKHLINNDKEKTRINKEIQMVRNRLHRITELEKAKKIHFREELEKLENRKKREQSLINKLKNSSSNTLHSLHTLNKPKL